MLVRYEFLKILRKKSTLIFMVVSLLLTGFLFGLPVMQYQTYNQNGVIKGAEGIAYEKELYKNLSVPLSETYVAQTIDEVHQLFEDPENVGYDGAERFIIGDAYWREIAPREKLLNLIANAYSRPNEILGYNNLPDSDTPFYQAIADKVENSLDKQTSEQKAYWTGMAEEVDTPLQYGYYEGWEIIISSFELLTFSILAVCIVIAPVFSGEYQAGTDAVLLSAKYGKTKLVTAKILASLLFGTIAFILHIVLACGLPLAAFGADGWDLPLQIANTAIPYPLTFLQSALVNIGVIYLVLLAMIGLTLFLSSKMKSPYLVLTVLVPVLFIPLFLMPNGTTGAYNLFLFLSPYRSTMPELGKYISCQSGGLVLDILSVRIILYSVLTALLLPLSGIGFKKRQAV